MAENFVEQVNNVEAKNGKFQIALCVISGIFVSVTIIFSLANVIAVKRIESLRNIMETKLAEQDEQFNAALSKQSQMYNEALQERDKTIANLSRQRTRDVKAYNKIITNLWANIDSLRDQLNQSIDVENEDTSNFDKSLENFEDRLMEIHRRLDGFDELHDQFMNDLVIDGRSINGIKRNLDYLNDYNNWLQNRFFGILRMDPKE